MATRDRLWSLATAATAALLLGAALAMPVFAEVGDGDGFDGDEVLLVPLVLGAVVVIGLVTFWRSRRSATERNQ